MAELTYSFNLIDPVTNLSVDTQSETIVGRALGREARPESMPGVMFLENILPTKLGFASVSHYTSIEGVPGFVCKEVKRVHSISSDECYIAFGLGNMALSKKVGDASWTNLGTVLMTPLADITKLTLGTVNGITYIYAPNNGLYAFDSITSTLVSQPVSGLDLSAILGITASSGYLIAYSKDAIAWSSTISPLDFFPSDITGAGGGKIADISGDIIFSTSSSTGILIYTESNIVSATYTGNAKYPFKFREVRASKGILDSRQVASESNSDSQFALTKAGLLSVTPAKADIILPELKDYISLGYLDSYSEVSNTIIKEGSYATSLVTKITFLASRYLVISLGTFGAADNYSQAIVYDTSLTKLGRLTIPHADIIDYAGELAIITKTASILKINQSAQSLQPRTICLGKVQSRLGKVSTLAAVELQGVDGDVEVRDLVDYDSDSFNPITTVAGTLVAHSGKYRKYAFRVTGLTHSIVIRGKFSLTSVNVIYREAGDR